MRNFGGFPQRKLSSLSAHVSYWSHASCASRSHGSGIPSDRWCLLKSSGFGFGLVTVWEPLDVNEEGAKRKT